MSSQDMDHKEVMMRIPVSGIPKGYKAVAIRPARPGELVASSGVIEGVSMTPSFWTSSIYSDYPMIILEKLYDPGIGIPNGWIVYKTDGGTWAASEIGGPQWRIRGLEYLPEFVLPTNAQMATVERPE